MARAEGSSLNNLEGCVDGPLGSHFKLRMPHYRAGTLSINLLQNPLSEDHRIRDD
jgi:hypothetical protein